jgi:type III restriction enzyme
MKLQFKEQAFQLRAVKAVVDVFAGQTLQTGKFTLERTKDILRKAKNAETCLQSIAYEEAINESIGYRNRVISITEAQVLQNIQNVQRQNELIESDKIERPKGEKSGYNLTIEMETGTGKTYTYIRTMYELHKHYGWSKYIIIVPSIAIREGVFKSFEVTQEHFQEIYGHKIKPFIYNSARPQDIENFAADSRISVMIINTQAFNAKGENARRIDMELDQFGSRKPIEIIAQTNPILIIDEPQSVDGKQTLESMQKFNALFTIRYSATHKEMYNQVYRLDALDAYNQKLVKRIKVKGINLKGSTGTTGYLYLERIEISSGKPPVAVVEYEVRKGDQIKRVREKLTKGDNLHELSGGMPAYLGYNILNIDAYLGKVEIGSQVLYPGEVVGDMNETDFRRIQIRETILSHLEKEKQLYAKGIKVLTLFFIDHVEKYRQYDETGAEVAGEYAQIFEQEYAALRSNYLDLFQQEYNEFLHKHSVRESHRGYEPTNYFDYLKRDDATNVHKGYFSIDKNKRIIDSSVKRGSEESDDISAYQLIMQSKERLLSFEEPVRFIFSHSALKEGWDNPNVFQICALKHSDATIRRRQEVGRGMRLCVNADGARQDYDTIGDEVQEINALTVVASESYEAFAKGLQNEIADTLKKRPQKADVEFFIGKLLTNEQGESVRLNKQQTEKLVNKLLYERTINEDNKLTDAGCEAVKQGNIALPDELKPYAAAVCGLLSGITTGELPKIDNERNKQTLTPNKNFYKTEFQTLWSKINLKTVYEVHFNSDKLIEDAVIHINADLTISERYYEVKSGEMAESTKTELEHNEGIKQTGRSVKKLNTELYSDTRYDIVGEIVTLTNLTRRTVAGILSHIHESKFILIGKNPEEFIAKCSTIINEVKSQLIVNHISYHKTDERFDAATVFGNDSRAVLQSEILKRHIYDYLITDSNIEKEFAKQLDTAEEVMVYAKLPKSFFITTPVGKYSPDWAIVFNQKKVRYVYFIAETKGTESELNLRGVEKLKKHCAEVHFSQISNDEVKYHVVKNYEGMLDLVGVK